MQPGHVPHSLEFAIVYKVNWAHESKASVEAEHANVEVLELCRRYEVSVLLHGRHRREVSLDAQSVAVWMLLFDFLELAVDLRLAPGNNANVEALSGQLVAELESYAI